MEIRARNKQKELNQTVETDKLFYAKILLISIAVLAFIERLAAYEGVPYILLVLLVLIFGYSFFTKRTISTSYLCSRGKRECGCAFWSKNEKS